MYQGQGGAGEAASRARGALLALARGRHVGSAREGRRTDLSWAPAQGELEALNVVGPGVYRDIGLRAARLGLVHDLVDPGDLVDSVDPMDSGDLDGAPTSPAPIERPETPLRNVSPADDLEPVDDAIICGVLLGVTLPSDPIDGLVAGVTTALSRSVGLAHIDESAPLIAATAGVAAAVSAGIEGASWPQRVALAAWACDEGAATGSYRPGPRLSARLTWACALAERAETDPVDVVALLVGNSAIPQEAVPAGFALATVGTDVPSTQRAAVALGGRSRTIAGLAGALVAAAGAAAGQPPSDPLGNLVGTLVTRRTAVASG